MNCLTIFLHNFESFTLMFDEYLFFFFYLKIYNIHQLHIIFRYFPFIADPKRIK